LAEASVILNWALEGCLAWQHGGLGVPDEVKEATESYKTEMDALAQFIADCCIVDPSASVLNKELYAAYISWCQENGEEPLRQRSLGRSLSERGFTPIKLGRKSERGWSGIRLRGPDEAADVSADMSGENVRNADQISKITKTRTLADVDFQVFSRNALYIEKNPESDVRKRPQNQDFADQNALADVSTHQTPSRGDDTDGEHTEEELDQIPCPF
jgi:phage/plasmid-associated DNA primase